jgi:hypothetical protein
MALVADVPYVIVNRATGTILTNLGNDPADNRGKLTLSPLAWSTTLTSFHSSVVYADAWQNLVTQQVREEISSAGTSR